VLAPLPVKVAVCPEQITVLLGVMVKLGVVFTEMLRTAEFVQPLAEVPKSV
jgi:hypothetical protein